jgi:hypothetical protein
VFNAINVTAAKVAPVNLADFVVMGSDGGDVGFRLQKNDVLSRDWVGGLIRKRCRLSNEWYCCRCESEKAGEELHGEELESSRGSELKRCLMALEKYNARGDGFIPLLTTILNGGALT